MLVPFDSQEMRLGLVVQRTVGLQTTVRSDPLGLHHSLPPHHPVSHLQIQRFCCPASLRAVSMCYSDHGVSSSPPAPVSGFAYCLSHSSDSQTG